MDQQFDVIIVGAGSAGCVLANRLTRDPNLRVLLLEAGGWDRHPLITVPVGCRKITEYGLYDWGDFSEPDPELNGRRLAVPHGKVIGGGSSVNYMAHTRGHPADYDGWAAGGAHGWSYADVLPFFKECETWERGADQWRGGSGELGVEESQLADPIFNAWFAAVKAQGYKITDDYNGEMPEGFGKVQYSIRNGRRSSASRAFLKPAMRRPNLTIQTNSMATRILFDGKQAVGIEYRRNGKLLTARSSKQTVLCLGAINTPQLLMLSGIGPAQHLKANGIEPLVDLPVGKNLEDHLGYSMHWTRRNPGLFHEFMRFDRIGRSFLLAYLTGRGPASRLPGIIMGFLRTKPDLVQPNLQLILQMMPADTNYWFPGIKRAYQDGFGIRVQLIGQKSRGEVLLRSKDPMERPIIHYNSLSEAGDLEILREGFKKSWHIAQSPEMADYRMGPLTPGNELKSDDEIDAFIRASALQLYHPGCTCRMGDGENTVTNPQLGVKGVDGLSIADTSIMPRLVSANVNVPAMMIGAKAAELITAKMKA